MKTKSRILITPRGSQEQYDENYRIVEAIATEWNLDGRPRMTVPGAIVLDRSSPKYHALRNLFRSRVKDVDPEFMKWSEVVEATYSGAELEQCEILTLHINGEAGLGGNAYAEVYELDTCPSCGSIRVRNQVRDLVADISMAKKDFASTLNFSERLVSSRLKVILDAQAAGIRFRPVHHAHPSRSVNRRYFQLFIDNVLKPLVAPKYAFAGRCETCGYERDGISEGPETPDP